MNLSVSSWSFPHLTLVECDAVASALGFDAIDLGFFFEPALDKTRLLADPETYGAAVARELKLPVANLFHLFGDDLIDRNLAGPANPQNLEDLKSALAFAAVGGGGVGLCAAGHD